MCGAEVPAEKPIAAEEEAKRKAAEEAEHSAIEAKRLADADEAKRKAEGAKRLAEEAEAERKAIEDAQRLAQAATKSASQTPAKIPAADTPTKQSGPPAQDDGRQAADRRSEAAQSAPIVPKVKKREVEAKNDGTRVVRVYYGTNRGKTNKTTPDAIFDASRSTTSYGYCDVSFPPGHRIGVVESPSVLKFWKLEFSEDPKKHVVVKEVTTASREDVIGRIKADTEQSPAKNLLLFVHGFGTTFESAAKRTAQIKYDLAFEGPAIFFSWPAVGGWVGKAVVNYLTDEESSRWSEDDIEQFVQSVVVESGAKNIYLIAHSMGSRPLSKAIAGLGRSPEKGYLSNIRQLILAAPDIDRDLFVKEVVPFVKGPPTRITVYASGSDLALRASEYTHGLYSRLGTTVPQPFMFDGIDTIDASNFASDFMGHDLPGARSILQDISQMIKDKMPVERRFGIEKIAHEKGWYYRMK